jgi:hypothetical protein
MTAREAMTPAPLTVTPRTSVGATLRSTTTPPRRW